MNMRNRPGAGHVRVLLGTAVAVFCACESPQAPVVCGSVPPQQLLTGESATVAVCFEDPNGDALAYTYFTSDPTVATVSGGGATVTVTAVTPGQALVTILADDGNHLKAQQSFKVLVPNRPPVALGEIADLELPVGDSVSMDVSGNFSDPDGQPLSYSAESDTSMVSGSLDAGVLTLAGLAKGTTGVELTGTDPGGLRATHRFSVTVPNQAPVPADSVAALMIEVGDTASFGVSPLFFDPDGDRLVHEAASSDSTVAIAAVPEGLVTVAALAKGRVTVTVTATDTEGLAAAQRFGVTVPNRAPVVADTIPARTVEVGVTDTLDIASFFTDPDGDRLSIEVAAVDGAVARAAANGRTVTVTGIAKGATMVEVTATDTEGLAADQAFAVTVPNRAPVVAGTIPAQTVAVGDSVSLAVSLFFADPDGDELAYLATTGDNGVAVASAVEGILEVAAVAKGRTAVTVTATDTEGLAVSQDFAVTVPNRAPSAVQHSLAARTAAVGDTITLDAFPWFSDPDGDTLVHAATSSDASVAKAATTGTTVTVTGVRKGVAIITATATDPGGLAASLVFAVTVPNRAPVAASRLGARRIPVRRTDTLDLATHFTDPDGDSLTFEAVSWAPRVAGVAVAGRALAITGRSQGAATLTVTATDDEGLSVEQQFRTTVTRTRTPRSNNPPTVSAPISAPPIAVGQSFEADLGDHFSDPDLDPLGFEAASSNETVATAAVTSGGTLEVTPVAPGSAMVTVTATDPGSLKASTDFEVTVLTNGDDNRAPTVRTAIGLRTIRPGEALTIELTGHFLDPDGDLLTFGASSSNPAAATAAVSGSGLTVTAVANGTTEVSVVASDPGNLTAAMDFEVVVRSSRNNRAPTVRTAIGLRTIRPGEALTIELTGHFLDPDGDLLTFGASSSNPAAATAAVSGSGLTVTAVANGTTEVSVVASDPGNLTAAMDFEVVVRSSRNNRAPTVRGQGFLDRQYVPTAAFAMDAWWHFEDPDDDPLSYSATSSNEAVARIEQDDPGDRIIWVRAVSDGESTITVKAEDLQGASLEQAFRFVVKNSDTPYVIEGRTITALPSIPGQVDTLEFSYYFWDDDRFGHGEVLRYSASSTDAGIVAVPTWHVMNGKHRHDYVDIMGKAVGEAMVTLTATDLAGESVSMSFPVTVDNNRQPYRQKEFPSLPSLPIGDTLSFTLADYFEDPEDGDNFSYADSLDGGKVWVEISNGVLYIGTKSDATVFTLRRVWITATDTGGKSVTQTFRVLLVPRSSNDSNPEPQLLVLSRPALQRATLPAPRPSLRRTSASGSRPYRIPSS